MNGPIEKFVHDVRFGFRMLRRDAGFAIAAVLTLALGIGANTAVFTVTSALLLRPLPYRDPQKLVLLEVKRKEGSEESDNGLSLGRYEEIREHNRSFSGMAAATNDQANITGHGEPVQVPIARITPNFFGVLGLTPLLRRTFTEDEGRPEGGRVVIISNKLWHTRFGGDPGIVGQSINLDSAPYTIIGVLPPNLQFPFIGPADVWSPRYFELSILRPQHIRSGVGYLTAVARLRSGACIESAGAEMELLNLRYTQENPKAPDTGRNMRMVVDNVQEHAVAKLRTGLLLLSGAVGLVLLIACANVASLLLSRAVFRRKEIAIRTALGASRGAIIRQLLVESMLLALAGGTLGFGLTWITISSLAASRANEFLMNIPIPVDSSILLFTIAVSVLSAVVFGAAPALQLSRDVNLTLRGAGRNVSPNPGGTQLKSLLVVGQIAFSMILLIMAGLLVRSFAHLLNVAPGFDASNVLMMNISLPTVKYADGQSQSAFFEELLRRVSVLPGVRTAAISAAPPLTRIRITPILVEGQPQVPLQERPFTIIEAISPRFFETMRIPLRAGRSFTDADTAKAPPVVMINEALARRYWPTGNPVGRHIAVGRRGPAEIVGVAGNVRNTGLGPDPEPQVYLPFPQLPWGDMNLLVRTAVPPQSLTSAVRGQIAAVDPDQPVTNVQSVEELMDASRAQPRLIMVLLGIFAASAVFLAAVGIYGLLSYYVSQRRQELGIRLALGAEKPQIQLLVVRNGMALAVIGIAIGLTAALVLTRAMASLLYKVGAHDLLTYVLTSVLFLVIALLATYLPAKQATRVDPAEALKQA